MSPVIKTWCRAFDNKLLIASTMWRRRVARVTGFTIKSGLNELPFPKYRLITEPINVTPTTPPMERKNCVVDVAIPRFDLETADCTAKRVGININPMPIPTHIMLIKTCIVDVSGVISVSRKNPRVRTDVPRTTSFL